jgi:MFS family permease
MCPRIKRVLPKPMIMLTSAVLYLAMMLSFRASNSFMTVVLSATFGGAAFGLVLSTGYNYVNDLAPQGLKSTAISLYSIGISVAGTLTNFVGGPIITSLGVRTLFLYSAYCVVGWIIIFLGSYWLGEKIRLRWESKRTLSLRRNRE